MRWQPILVWPADIIGRANRRGSLDSGGPAAAEKLVQQLTQPDALTAAESLWTLRQARPSLALIMERGLQRMRNSVLALAVQPCEQDIAFRGTGESRR
ncbi:MAG: hypothetical protein R3C56_15390 [Pirellulaceae bacterium]